MIKSFKHKGLEQYFTKDIKKGLDAKDLAKITRSLIASMLLQSREI